MQPRDRRRVIAHRVCGHHPYTSSQRSVHCSSASVISRRLNSIHTRTLTLCLSRMLPQPPQQQPSQSPRFSAPDACMPRRSSRDPLPSLDFRREKNELPFANVTLTSPPPPRTCSSQNNHRQWRRKPKPALGTSKQGRN